MASDEVVERVRALRRLGCSPKQIARALHLPPAQVAPSYESYPDKYEQTAEWQRKGATLSDKTARKEFGLTQDEIYDAIPDPPRVRGMR